MMDNRLLYTIGYQGVSLEEFAECLMSHDIDCLIDVRANAMSRKKGFSKKALSAYIYECGIDYVHIPTSGIPSNERKKVKTDTDVDNLLCDYRIKMEQKPYPFAQVLAAVMSNESPALMCFEEYQNKCHRSVLAELVSEDTGIPICNLFPTKRNI